MSRGSKESADRRPANGLPTSDLNRLTPMTIDAVITAYMAASGVRSAPSIRRAVQIYAPESVVEDGLQRLIAGRALEPRQTQWALAPVAWKGTIPDAILKTNSDWARVKRVILPMAALGLPLQPSSVRHFSHGDHLRAAALTVLYRLPLDPITVRLGEVRECLLVRSLAARFPDVRFAPVRGTERLDAFSTAVLNGLAEVPSDGAVEIVHQLAAQASHSKDPSLDGLRRALVTAALAPHDPITGLNGANELDWLSPAADGFAKPGDFARRVQSFVDNESTPPFDDRLAIGALYDLYLAKYPGDADSLAAFKARLLDAHRGRWLSLRRLDYIDAIDDELRRRSEIEVDGRQFHFVARVS